MTRRLDAYGKTLRPNGITYCKGGEDLLTRRNGEGDLEQVTRSEIEGHFDAPVVRRRRVVTVAQAEVMIAAGWTQNDTGRWCHPDMG